MKYHARSLESRKPDKRRLPEEYLKISKLLSRDRWLVNTISPLQPRGEGQGEGNRPSR